MDLKRIEAAMVQTALFELALMLLFTALFFWLTYVCIKAGVRDGIKESGLVDRARARAAAPELATAPTPLPDMRAER